MNCIACKGKQNIKVLSQVLRKESGEILFTDYGISGPVVFAVSRIPSEFKECKIDIDFMPEFSFMDVVKMLEGHRKIMNTVEESSSSPKNSRPTIPASTDMIKIITVQEMPITLDFRRSFSDFRDMKRIIICGIPK